MTVGRSERQSRFAELVLSVLRASPAPTSELYLLTKGNFPELCDDDDITDTRYEPKWKHDVRWAQQDLRERGLIFQDEHTSLWHPSQAGRIVREQGRVIFHAYEGKPDFASSHPSREAPLFELLMRQSEDGWVFRKNYRFGDSLSDLYHFAGWKIPPEKGDDDAFLAGRCPWWLCVVATPATSVHAVEAMRLTARRRWVGRFSVFYTQDGRLDLYHFQASMSNPAFSDVNLDRLSSLDWP